MFITRRTPVRHSYFLLATLLIASGPAQAAIECRFDSGSGGTTTLVNGISSNNIRWSQSSGPGYSNDEVLLATVDLTLSPSLQSTCSLGNDGEVLKEKADTAYVRATSSYDDSAILYYTNIPGIYFTTKIYSDAGGGFFKNTGAAADGWETLEADHNDERWKNKTWKALIHIYQYNSEFAGNTSGITTLTPKASFSLGQMAIGDRTDSNNKPWTFNVTPTSFQIPIITTTCQAAALSDGSTNIDLGDYMLADFNQSTRTQYVAVQLKGCNNLFGVDVKITANKTTGSSNDLLGNTLTTNAASGVGVKLMSGSNTSFQFIPNSFAETHYSFDTGSSTTANVIDFTAQLVKDGNTMKAGEFRAAATVLMTYY
ncbi:fimbrial protein [Citrobacter sp. U14242]|uniref:fimbrial protein n=1 Tax=Citrobacter sp. U14242 TaxID=3390192 RepID=UPI00397E1479